MGWETHGSLFRLLKPKIFIYSEPIYGWKKSGRSLISKVEKLVRLVTNLPVHHDHSIHILRILFGRPPHLRCVLTPDIRLSFVYSPPSSETGRAVFIYSRPFYRMGGVCVCLHHSIDMVFSNGNQKNFS